MSLICSFFGHRNTDNAVYSDLYREVERHITEKNADTFYVSRYGNFDRMVSGISHEMKKRYPHITVYHVLAYMPANSGKNYEEPFPTLYPEGLELVPKKFAISHRNRWIVNESDYIIGYVATSYGGAYEALKYARQKGKNIVNLANKKQM